MLQYLDKLNECVLYYGLELKDFVIVGSGVITVKGGRLNNDIEFSLSPRALKKLPFHTRIKLLFFDHVKVTENVDLFKDRYISFGLKDKEIFNDRMINTHLDYNIVIPEIELVYKCYKNRPKDILDFKQIHENPELEGQFDWSIVKKYLDKKTPKRYMIYERFRGACWHYTHHEKLKILNKLVWGGTE